jgi:hypothetical protein
VGFAALITWMAAVSAGLYMLMVWLIEDDVTGRDSAPSRLPVPVIFSHLALALTGLAVWIAYLILDRQTLAWAAFGLLSVVVLLGGTMFARWIPVYRAPDPPLPVTARLQGITTSTPPEGSFPVVLVAAHGVLAVSTLALVLLTALGVDGS